MTAISSCATSDDACHLDDNTVVTLWEAKDSCSCASESNHARITVVPPTTGPLLRGRTRATICLSPDWIVVLKVWKESEKTDRFSLIILAGCVAILAALLIFRL